LNSVSFGQINGLFVSPVKLYHLLDELPLSVVILDPGRRILFLNSSFEVLSGFDRSRVVGVPCRHVLRSNICHQKCVAVQARENQGPVTIEGNIINKEHKRINVRVTAVPLSDEQGNTVGFLETIEDISTLQLLDDNLQRADGFGKLIGRSEKMEEVFRLIPVIAQTDSSILITGETGTGKDLVAESIHKVSERAKGSFVKINCGALPETLLESELFGHKEGAFTGATSDKAGRMRMAHNGTLYLTEIGDLPLPLQVKLLTFLDDQVVHPLGSNKGFQADVRIIAATHRNLEQMVLKGDFRQDLLFRLNVVHLHLPPLRERDGDAWLLMEHFLKVFSTKFNKKIMGLSEAAKHLILNYPYPGNVRELRNIIEYASNICSSEKIGVEDLPGYLNVEKNVGDGDEASDIRAWPVLKDAANEKTSEMDWASIERQLIVDTLVKVKGRRNEAAQILGWGRSTLWRKMKRYGLES